MEPAARSSDAPANASGRATIGFIILLCAIAGTIAKLPAWFSSANPEEFYPRNLGFAILAPITAYFIARQTIGWLRVCLIAATFVICAIVINLYPPITTGKPVVASDSLALACLHLPLFLWTIAGFAFCGREWRDPNVRIGFLRLNGEALINTALISIAGALMTAITIALFAAIKLDIARWYLNWVVVYGACSAPIVAVHLAISRRRRIAMAPLLARIFSPLALITLSVYLIAIAIQRRSPYADREFLLIFNVMLVCVLAIAVFCICERRANRFFDLTILFLVCVAVIIDAIALSAIVLRLSSYGFTPNRTVTLVSNLLVLANLLAIAATFTRPALRALQEAKATEKWIARFLPVYSAWTAVVVFVLPALFRFR